MRLARRLHLPLPRRLRLPAVLHTAPARIVIGLMSLLICVLLLLDAGFSAFNSRETQARRERALTSENIGLQFATLLREMDERSLRRAAQQIVSHDANVRSVGVRRADGTLAVASEGHAGFWDGKLHDPMREAALPLWRGDERWGQVEIAYGPLRWEGPLGGILDTPAIFVMCFLGIGGVFAYAFVRRALVHLDPSTAVPNRVRSAYDTLAEGVVIVDSADRIVLANAAFRRLCGLVGDDSADLHGKKLGDVGRIGPALPAREGVRSWADIVQAGDCAQGVAIDLPDAAGGTRKVVLRCAPIRDNAEQLRGTLLSLSDQTEVEQANMRLLQLNAALEASREQITRQNAQLLHMANHDALTGCLNRRAFFAQAGQAFERAQAEGRRVAVLMTDVDHFKSFNDRFGHSTGDEVLRGVARALGEVLPQGALLARYGGEEFCVLVLDLDRKESAALAERMRAHVESSAGAALGHRVTSSFGLATLTGTGRTLAALLDKADQALYKAKEDGRNRVAVSVGQGSVSVSGGEVPDVQEPPVTRPAELPKAPPAPFVERRSGMAAEIFAEPRRHESRLDPDAPHSTLSGGLDELPPQH